MVKHNVEYLQFSFRWMNNLLMRELPLRCTIRLWDTYLVSLSLYDGDDDDSDDNDDNDNGGNGRFLYKFMHLSLFTLLF